MSNIDISKNESEKPSLFRNSDFMAILSGGLISDIGTYFSFIAILFLAVKLKIDQGATTAEVAVAIAFITIIQLIPTIFVGPFAGVFVDRNDRKKIMIVADMAGALASLSLILVSEMWHIYGIVAVFSLVRVFFAPARGAAFPLIVEQENLMQANGLIQITSQSSRIVGPAVAGLIIAAFNYRLAFIIDAGTFLFSAIMIMTISRNLNVVSDEVKEKTSVKQVIGDLKEGYQLTFKDQIVGYLVVLFMFAMFFIGFLDPLFIVYLTQYFGLNEADFGMILSLSAIAGFIGAIIMTVFGKKMKRKLSFITSSLLVMGVAMVIGAISSFQSSIPLLYLSMIMIGMINVLVSIPMSTLLQTIIDPKHLGKVTAFFQTTIIIAQLLGALVATQMVQFIGIDWIYFIIGVSSFVAGIFAFIYMAAKKLEPNAQNREAEAITRLEELKKQQQEAQQEVIEVPSEALVAAD